VRIRRLYKTFTDILGRTPLHPQFFSKHFLDRQIKLRGKGILGIVADVGCGFQPYKKHFTQAKYVSLDYPSAIRRSASESPDIFGDLTSLPLRGNCVNAVLCTQVLEHISEPEKALVEIGRVLRPDGKLMLSTPFFYPLHDEPHDYFRYSPHGLERMLSAAHLELMELVPQGGFVEMAGEFLNLFGIHKTNNLIAAGGYRRILGLVFIPLLLPMAFINNILCLILSPLDKERRFVMNYFILAKRL
jgi:SAM-dependent methyltransferase